MSGFIQMPDGHPGALGSATAEKATTYTAAPALDPEEERKRKRSTQVLESAESSSTQTEKFCAYYCFACGSFCLAMEGLLHNMPKRKTDHATVVQRKAVLKLGVEEAESKHIQRDKGLEKQFRTDISEVELIYLFDTAVVLNPSVVSLYWPDSSQVETEGARFCVRQFTDKMQVQCKADAVGGDMTNANKEITKCLAAMLGVSRKQVQIMGLMVVVLDVEGVDVFRRLLCSMY